MPATRNRLTSMELFFRIATLVIAVALTIAGFFVWLFFPLAIFFWIIFGLVYFLQGRKVEATRDITGPPKDQE